MSGERVRHPRVLVGVIPNRDTNTALHDLACLDHVLVISLLLLEQRRGGWERHPDVEFRNGDLDAESGEGLEVGLEVGGDLTDDEVALEADAVDGDVGGLERFDEVEHSGSFGALLLNVIVVDVELRSGIGSACGLEGGRNVGGAEGVVEDVAAPGSVIVEGFCAPVISIRMVGSYRRDSPLITSQLSIMNSQYMRCGV